MDEAEHPMEIPDTFALINSRWVPSKFLPFDLGLEYSGGIDHLFLVDKSSIVERLMILCGWTNNAWS
ncbi:hypothetical protein JTE90_020533 [Oedothorax gibbosus]|uniref:Uncharacterized protein n=1 Tax=Oedothorax gibbosus TaxID=931172 RepID=A0AAV6VXJ3_9ARAC|nr:hypothetical protein JTE90_020533 [Oedothorax gibbosus]